MGSNTGFMLTSHDEPSSCARNEVYLVYFTRQSRYEETPSSVKLAKVVSTTTLKIYRSHCVENL